MQPSPAFAGDGRRWSLILQQPGKSQEAVCWLGVWAPMWRCQQWTVG